MSNKIKYGFILITNKYSEKHDCYIYRKKNNKSFIVLYQYDKNGDKTDYELCCIKVNGNYINPYSDLINKQLSNCIRDK